jgi:tetratricopeptide (TPR) repeat protein
MTFSGDLASIDLADLLQNIETHERTGTLTLKSDTGASRIFVRQGKIAMFAADNRPPLGDMLVAAGIVSAKKLEAARRKQRGSRKTLAEVLIASKFITDRDLHVAGQDFLSEDVANLVASAAGEFQFQQGDDVPEGFDPDEAWLELSLPISPVVLEATRRSDHWVLIRKFIPSDTIHFVARESAEVSDEVADPEIADALLRALDGTRCIGEVVDLFPSRRFLAYRILSDFVRDRMVRAAEADDLVSVAESLATSNPERAHKLVTRGLEAEPHHLGLLTLAPDLAERLKLPAAGAAALKMLAHLKLEAGQIDEGRALLEKAKLMTPGDTAIWERALAVALQQGRRQDAVGEGMKLVELYRAPGLHAKAKEVLDRLLKVDPDSVELKLEYARTQVDSGDPQAAVRGLLRAGKVMVTRESYTTARILYEQVLAIEPSNREGTISIEMIDKETFARRRERKRRAIRIVITGAIVALTSVLLYLETSARLELVETTSQIDRQRIIERGAYEEAISLLEGVAKRHPLTATTLLDVRRRLEDLRARLPTPATPTPASPSPSGSSTAAPPSAPPGDRSNEDAHNER